MKNMLPFEYISRLNGVLLKKNKKFKMQQHFPYFNMIFTSSHK
jgi:hypothetical protein